MTPFHRQPVKFNLLMVAATTPMINTRVKNLLKEIIREVTERYRNFCAHLIAN